MRLRKDHIETLIRKLSEPDLSPKGRLIALRRLLRHDLAEVDAQRTEIGQEIRRLKAGLPFTQAQLDKAERTLSEGEKDRRRALVQVGQYLRDNSDTFDALVGWDGLCDVLCVNPVHRASIPHPEHGLFAIAWIGGQFEDSATHHGRIDSCDLGPLSTAIDAATMDWMMNNMDKLPDPFAPGGPFYGAPIQRLHSDGTVSRQSPALVVHDRDGGQQVVERAPEVKP